MSEQIHDRAKSALVAIVEAHTPKTRVGPRGDVEADRNIGAILERACAEAFFLGVRAEALFGAPMVVGAPLVAPCEPPAPGGTRYDLHAAYPAELVGGTTAGTWQHELAGLSMRVAALEIAEAGRDALSVMPGAPADEVPGPEEDR